MILDTCPIRYHKHTKGATVEILSENGGNPWHFVKKNTPRLKKKNFFYVVALLPKSGLHFAVTESSSDCALCTAMQFEVQRGGLSPENHRDRKGH